MDVNGFFDLDSQANGLISVAEENMSRDGYLIPAGVVYRPDGEAVIYGLSFSSGEDKQRCFQTFRSLAREQEAVAIAFISEAWVHLAKNTGNPVDLDESIEDPKNPKEEVVVVTVATEDDSVVKMASILRDGESFKGLGETRSEGKVLDAEFTRGVWEKLLN